MFYLMGRLNWKFIYSNRPVRSTISYDLQEKCVEQKVPLYSVFISLWQKSFLDCPWAHGIPTKVCKDHPTLSWWHNWSGSMVTIFPFEIRNSMKQGCIVTPVFIILMCVLFHATQGLEQACTKYSLGLKETCRSIQCNPYIRMKRENFLTLSLYIYMFLSHSHWKSYSVVSSKLESNQIQVCNNLKKPFWNLCMNYRNRWLGYAEGQYFCFPFEENKCDEEVEKIKLYISMLSIKWTQDWKASYLFQCLFIIFKLW